MKHLTLLSIFLFSALLIQAQDCPDDNVAPVFSSLPQDQVISCGEDAPEQVTLTATDNCDEIVDVIATSSVEFNEVCEFTNTSWPGADQLSALKIFDENNDHVFMELMDIIYNETYEVDGTSNVVMTGTFKDHNSEGGFYFSVLLHSGMNWDQWSNQDYPTGYHGDSGADNGEHLDWRYYLMDDNSYLEGWGTWEETFFHLSHAPINFYYCFQKGMGANNTAYVPGIGGWFYATGMHNGEEVTWQGDIALEMNCCTEQTVLNEWTATDSSGNTSVHVQNISSNALVGLPVSNCAGDFDADNLVGTHDLLFFLSKFACNENCGEVDFNQNGMVESADLLFMMSRIGGSCN